VLQGWQRASKWYSMGRGRESAVVDSVDDVIIGDSVSAEGGLPVDSLGGPVGVPGLTPGSEDKLLEGDPSG
jgi:hypothetical protein